MTASRAVRVVVDSVLRVPVADLVGDEESALRAQFRYPNPAFAQAQKTGRDVRFIPATLTTTREENGVLLLPRGATRLIRAALPGARFVDRRQRLADVAFALAGTLRDYQTAAVSEAMRRQQGALVAPTGSGKTTIGCALIAAARQPALVLVPTVDLAEQWVERIRLSLGIEASCCTGGAFEIAAVTVATIPTVSRPERLSVIASAFGLVIFDEAHHVVADTFAAVANACAARYRFGLTATPERGDGRGPLLEHFLGGIIHEVTIADLTRSGMLAEPRFVTVPTEMAFAYGSAKDWPALLSALVVDASRNEMIVGAVARECRGGVTGLILTGRVEHALALAEMLRARGLRCAALVGTMSKRERSKALEQLRSGELDAVVATSLADEGLDVPRLSRLFLAFPGKSESKLTQRIGRVLRPHPDKGTPLVFDFVDTRIGVLAHQARKRAALFAKLWGNGSQEAA